MASNIHVRPRTRLSVLVVVSILMIIGLHEYINHWLLCKETKIIKQLPKVIYILWDKGWVNAPPLQRMCLKSILRHNSDFTIKAINMTEAEYLISRKDFYTDSVWDQASLQAKSDIIRIELLANYGGIWVDSTVYFTEPLTNWINDCLFSVKFFAYEKKDVAVNINNSPWIASWFLMATADSDMIQMWRSLIRKAWTKDPLPPKTHGYYWVHRLFRELVISNTKFGQMFKKMPFLSADVPHCFYPDNAWTHMYKLSAVSCNHIRPRILARENITTVA